MTSSSVKYKGKEFRFIIQPTRATVNFVEIDGREVLFIIIRKRNLTTSDVINNIEEAWDFQLNYGKKKDEK